MNDNRKILFTKTPKEMENVVKAMHTIVSAMNNENAYFNHWIYIVPDNPSEEDFKTIARDKDLLSSVVDEFEEIVKKYFK